MKQVVPQYQSIYLNTQTITQMHQSTETNQTKPNPRTTKTKNDNFALSNIYITLVTSTNYKGLNQKNQQKVKLHSLCYVYQIQYHQCCDVERSSTDLLRYPYHLLPWHVGPPGPHHSWQIPEQWLEAAVALLGQDHGTYFLMALSLCKKLQESC